MCIFKFHYVKLLYCFRILKAYEYFKRRIPIYEVSSDQLLMSMAKEIITQVRLLGDEVITVKKSDEQVLLPD